MVEVDEPSGSIGPVPMIVELPAEAEPPINVTFPPVTMTGLASESNLICALVELRVQVETPVASDEEQVP
jgi:hypothetical protein